MSKFYNKLYSAVDVDKDSMEAKLSMKKPVVNKSTYRPFKKRSVFQADLIYMPNDNGYTYLLVVVDIASRIMDAEPLRGRQGADVVFGFHNITHRGTYIKKDDIDYLYTDPGSEFKNDVFALWCERSNIVLRHTRTARKNQMAIVEYENHILTKVLGVKMTVDELKGNEGVHKWVDKINPLVKAINENTDHDKLKIKDFFKDQMIGKNEKVLEVGTMVHIPLEQPKDMDGNRLHGKFRHGDQRYERQLRKIERVLMYPNQPVRYMVEGIKNASYLSSELLREDEYKRN